MLSRGPGWLNSSSSMRMPDISRIRPLERWEVLLKNPTNNWLIQLFRYCFVGGLAFLVDYGLLALLTEVFGLHYLVSATIAFIAGLVVNYFLSTSWVFRQSTLDSKWAEFFVFSCIGVVGLGLNNLIIMLFEKVLGPRQVFGAWLNADKYYIIGKVVATVVVFVWNFGMRKLLLYRGKPAAKDGSDADVNPPAP